jgi:Protein of unknown function (DUF3515)
MRGVVACAALLLASGCSTGPVEIDSPSVTGAEKTACRQLVSDLPASVAGQDARDISPGDALGAAWGDPAIVLTCGVGTPEDFDRFSTCMQADGVGWYVPDAELLDEDQSSDITMTAVGYRPRVQVVVPGTYRPEGVAAAMSALGRTVGQDLRLVERCK